MRILIVDDERPARDKLRRLLADQSGIEAVGEACDAFDALARMPAFRPDALFLDIEMPELSGLELAASLPEPAPLLVFVTAWDQHAIRAFDLDAIDYLLKPYDAARLQRALQRLRARVDARADARASASAPDNEANTEGSTKAASDAAAGSEAAGDPAADPAAAPEPAMQKLPRIGALRQLLVTQRGGTRVVRTDEIRWIETADNYVALHTAAGSPLLRQTLAGLVERLGPDFVRCHRRAAVRLSCIERVLPRDKGDCELLLQDGMRAPCSRQYRAAVLARLGAADQPAGPA
jgi:two-component system LytT family response regulator